MKFKVLFSIVFLCSITTLANVQKVEILRVNKQGAREFDFIEVSGRNVYLNARTSTSPEALKIAQRIIKFNRYSPSLGCASGKMTIVKETNGRSLTAHSCTEGKAYGEFIQDLYRLSAVMRESND